MRRQSDSVWKHESTVVFTLKTFWGWIVIGAAKPLLKVAADTLWPPWTQTWTRTVRIQQLNGCITLLSPSPEKQAGVHTTVRRHRSSAELRLSVCMAMVGMGTVKCQPMPSHHKISHFNANCKGGLNPIVPLLLAGRTGAGKEQASLEVVTLCMKASWRREVLSSLSLGPSFSSALFVSSLTFPSRCKYLPRFRVGTQIWGVTLNGVDCYSKNQTYLSVDHLLNE